MRLCTAKSSRTGEPCKRSPIKGGTVCTTHGGSSPNAKHHAALRLATAKADRLMTRDAPPVTDSLSALRLLAGEAMRAREYFAGVVGELEQLRYQAGAGEQVRAELVLWERAMDRAQKFCLDLAKLNLEERELALAKRQADMVLAVMLSLIDHHVPEDDREAARVFASDQLRGRVISGEARPSEAP